MNGNATKGDIINLETNTFKIARAQLTKYQYCRFCNSGSYQNEIGALVCKACPAGTTTMILGTKQLSGRGDGVAEPGIRTGVKSLQTSHDAHETITALAT